MSDDEIQVRKLIWQSRRGMLELDLLLEPFAKNVYRTLAAEDQQRFVKLLACEDQDLFVWFMERAKPEDPDLYYMVRMILDRIQSTRL